MVWIFEIFTMPLLRLDLIFHFRQVNFFIFEPVCVYRTTQLYLAVSVVVQWGIVAALDCVFFPFFLSFIIVISLRVIICPTMLYFHVFRQSLEKGAKNSVFNAGGGSSHRMCFLCLFLMCYYSVRSERYSHFTWQSIHWMFVKYLVHVPTLVHGHRSPQKLVLRNIRPAYSRWILFYFKFFF